MSIKVKPLGNNILIKPLEREEKLPSGLVIPDTAKEKPQEGKVVAAGPGKYEDGKRVAPEVKVGDRVLYKRFGGDEIRVGDKEYLVVDADDILAVIGE
ncbi:MAG: co-chaperone GroES [Patescibacteria group bacterium]|nr:MAG: co-chaperone GroES [Patescibacteria group bacterium]